MTDLPPGLALTHRREWAAFDDYGPIPWAVTTVEGDVPRLFTESDDVRVREIWSAATEWSEIEPPMV